MSHKIAGGCLVFKITQGIQEPILIVKIFIVRNVNEKEMLLLACDHSVGILVCSCGSFPVIF